MTATEPRLVTSSSRIGTNVVFGRNVSISANSIEIGDNVIIGDNVSIDCRGDFSIGHHGIIGIRSRVQCNNLAIGEWFYSCEGLEIGSGGCYSKDSNVRIGDRVGIFERVLINPNFEVSIGDNCGIGREVQIWTHGAWLDPMQGFPADFGPVSIGKNVWLPARVIMLPNTSVGENCVIGINSIINKHIPAGSFAAGAPVRIIRQNAYPAVLAPSETTELITKIICDWQVQIDHKAPDLKYSVECFDVDKVRLRVDADETIFDCGGKSVRGATNPFSEDFRDYLRRRGVKIYTDNFFKSI